MPANDIFRFLARGRPNEPAFWPNGLPGPDIENGIQPVLVGTNVTGYDKTKNDYILTTGKIEIKIPGIEGLKVTATASLDKFARNGKNWKTPWHVYSWDGVTFEADGKTPKLVKSIRANSVENKPALAQTNETQLSTTLSTFINYDRKFKDHSAGIMIAAQSEKREGESFGANRQYYISASLPYLSYGDNRDRSNFGTAYANARLGYFGRLSYNYKERYLFEFIGRYDGSYTFAKDNRFGFFPGVLAGWRISEEDFFQKNISFISSLKLRASWGKVGAEPYIGPNLAQYQFLPQLRNPVVSIGDNAVTTLQEALLPNFAFTWEKQINTNFGLDASILNNKVNITFDYFINKRSDALFSASGIIPQYAIPGGRLPVTNYAKLQNKGWEFSVDYSDKIGDVTFTVGLNSGYSRNKIVLWNEPPGVPDLQKSTGKPFGTNGSAYLIYITDGVFSSQADIDKNTVDYTEFTTTLRPGDLRFKDISGPDGKPDGKITADDRKRINKTRDPYLTSGFNLSLGYKRFDLTLLLQGAVGGAVDINTESGSIGNFLASDYTDRWSIENPSSKYPRLADRNNTFYSDRGGAGANDFYLRNTDYLRLKNLEIGYTVSSALLHKANINHLRFFVTGLNLLTWSSLNGFDPENTGENYGNYLGQYYPQSRVINFGASIKF